MCYIRISTLSLKDPQHDIVFVDGKCYTKIILHIGLDNYGNNNKTSRIPLKDNITYSAL